MSRVVWKYTLGPLDNELSVPPGTEFLYATFQHGEVVAYALVHVEQAKRKPEPRHLFVVSTGSEGLPVGKLKPLGVANFHNGNLMFHVFETWP